MCVIPTFAEEDAKRPHRERETLVGEHTSIINRIEWALARLGKLQPQAQEALERLEHLRTPEGEPINTLAELQRDQARKQLVAIACLIVCRWTRCHRRSPHSISTPESRQIYGCRTVR
jgi:transposase